MRIRFAAILLVLVATGTAAAAGPAPGPTGLHAFLLEADESATTVFHTTPSFGWDPVPGAVNYQFQLSTSSTFRENAVFYNSNSIVTPVAAPPLVLPWITGSPHSLYARVRATVTGGDVTQWSEWGFDVVAPAAPTPLPSDPGLLRWSPAPGATSYEVWLIDVPDVSKAPGVGKQEFVHTNVLDEREFYTFHQSSKWIATVRWRVRAVRSGEEGGPQNGLPATTYGPWSSIYTSSNPAVTGGPITPLHTISDVTSDGSVGSPAHRLEPGFTWKGSQTLSGVSAELFRVYVFTDAQCLNEVYESPTIGSPAYAPRLFGPLALPGDSAGIATARGGYLPDGAQQPRNETLDGTVLSPQEQAGAATPTTVAPPDLNAGDTAPTPAPGSSSGTGSSSSSSSGSSSGSSAPATVAAPGAPVDLWDTDYWPKGGYYWIVVGVKAVSAVPSAATVAAPGASKSSTLVPVSDTTQFAVGESVTIGVAPNSDTTAIAAIGNGLVTLTSPLNFGHAVGEPITSTASSGVVYRDMDLPQDVCAQMGAVHVPRFGIASESAVTAGQDAFATGLSTSGHLYSASQTSTFYGQPLVAWPPILRADRYEVEWSAKAYPYSATGQLMTPSTSVMLPLPVGTWYYRVRGFDDNLPTGAQSLGWSDTTKIVVAAAKFRIVKSTKNKFKIVGKGK